MTEPILVAQSKEPIFLLPKMANRHGLIAGATGTGKTVTLQTLAENFSARGVAVFMADVKGDLAGLSQPVPALAFEYLPRALDRVDACVDRLRALDHYVYNWSPGESYRLTSDRWLEGPQLLESLRLARRSGDVYARRVPATSI